MECMETCICENVALENAWKILTASKQRTFVAVQISPAVRVAIGEKFGLSRGEDAAGKIVSALELLGADVVVDTAVAFDAITLIRSKELIANKEAGKGLPLYSSECSAWVEFAKEKYPEIELLPTSTTVCAKLLKKYYGEIEEGKPIRVIALEMGKAKKADPGVDVVLTLDELAELIESADFNIRLMKKSPMQTPLGISSGAGYIQAASGGDAEALARCLTADKTQLNFRKFGYSGLYAKQDRREAKMTLDGQEWKFAVVDSLTAAEELIADIQAGKVEYDYVEVTACQGGQIGMGCDLSTEQGEMTRRLRKLGLSYLDQKRAARSAEVNASASLLLKGWNAIVRSGLAEELNEIPEIVEDLDEVTFAEEPVEETVEEVTEEVVEEVAEEVAEETVEEVAEETVEEVVEETVEEVAEETPVEEEIAVEEVEEISEEEEIAEVLEVFEEAIQEELEEANTEETEETPVEEEVVEEATEEEAIEEALEVFEEQILEDLAEAEEEDEKLYEEYVDEQGVVRRRRRRLSTKERRKLKRANRQKRKKK